MKKKGLKKVLATMVVLGIAVSITACGGSVPKDSSVIESTPETAKENTKEEEKETADVAEKELLTVNIGCSSLDGTTMSSSMLNTAIDQGFLEEEFAAVGAVPEYYPITGGGPATNEALAGGSLDFGVMGSFAATNGKDSGIETSVVAFDGGIGGAVITKKQNNINSISDLVGKKVGVTLGTSWEELFVAALNENGISKNDVELVNLGLSDVYEALLLDQIDAMVGAIGMLGDDITNIMNGDLIILADSRTDENLSVYGYHLVSSKFEEKHPEVVQAYVNALYRATEYAVEHPETIRERFSDVSDEVYDWLYADYIDLLIRTSLDESAITYGTRDIAFMYDNSLITENVDVNEWFHTSYYENVAGE